MRSGTEYAARLTVAQNKVMLAELDISGSVTPTVKLIAKSCGVSESYVRSTRKSLVYRREIERRREKALDIIADAQGRAAKRLCELLDSNNERIALDAATRILGSLLSMPTQRVELTALELSRKMTHEEAVDTIRQLMSRQVT